jgi:hypothetical protein
MKRYLLLAHVLLLSALVSCAAIGPISSPEFPTLVNNAIPASEGKVQIFGAGNWFPNLLGFTGVRSFLLAPPAESIPGVFVITDTSLLFLQWHQPEERFEVVKRLLYSEILSVSLDSYGLNRRLVVRKKDLSFDTFDFTKGNGTLVDTEKVEAAFALLRDRFKP